MTFEQIMIILAIISFSIAIYFMIQIGIELQQVAEAFNMTDELIEEERKLMLCIEWHIQNPECSMLVGSIDNSNGEPIK